MCCSMVLSSEPGIPSDWCLKSKRKRLHTLVANFSGSMSIQVCQFIFGA